MTFASEAICLFSFFFSASLFGFVASHDVDFYMFYFFHQNSRVDRCIVLDDRRRSQASMRHEIPSKYQHSINKRVEFPVSKLGLIQNPSFDHQ